MLWSETESLKKFLRTLETLKEDIMRRINELEDLNVESPKYTTVYPLAQVKPKIINGYPVFQFSYEGALPLYDKEDNYPSLIRHYYFRATFDAYDFSKITLKFNHACMVMLHYFQDTRIRDLDNRNRKYIQDAIRQTGIINDDNWRTLTTVEQGHHDPSGSHVQVYVFGRENLNDFMAYLDTNHKKESKSPQESLKESILKEIFEEGMVKKEIVSKYKGEKEQNLQFSSFW